MWSEPHRVMEIILNSYKLEPLDGQLLEGEYHVRQLQELIPRDGTELVAQQKEADAKRAEEAATEIEEDPEEDEAVENNDGELQKSSGGDNNEEQEH